MEQYSHPPDTEGLLLRDGQARAVPPSDRGAVLHLGEALSSQLLEQVSDTLHIQWLLDGDSFRSLDTISPP